jgi:hypothetical protein
MEFRHKVFLAGRAQRLITPDEVPTGNPADEHHVKSSPERHKEAVGDAGSGFFSEKHRRI